jgi:hypothetical protein
MYFSTLYSLTSINCVVTVRGVADFRNVTDGRTDGRTSSVWASGVKTLHYTKRSNKKMYQSSREICLRKSGVRYAYTILSRLFSHFHGRISYTVSVEKMWTQNTCIIHDVWYWIRRKNADTEYMYYSWCMTTTDIVKLRKTEWLWKFGKRNDLYENFEKRRGVVEKRGRRKRNSCPMRLWNVHIQVRCRLM